MTRLNLFLLVCVLVACVGCGDDDGVPGGDAGGGVDASAGDGAVGVDSGVELDGAVVDDAGEPGDAGPGADAGVATADAGPSPGCAPGSAIADRIAGVCDGRGMMSCSMWARMNGGTGATAQCTPPDGRCGRGDVCSAEGCTCGGAPECADDQMCVADAAGGTFHCACITPA